MVHRATADFWKDYDALPAGVRARADKQFALLKNTPQTHRFNSRRSATAMVKKSGLRG
jgi:hypothetical protein